MYIIKLFTFLNMNKISTKKLKTQKSDQNKLENSDQKTHKKLNIERNKVLTTYSTMKKTCT